MENKIKLTKDELGVIMSTLEIVLYTIRYLELYYTLDCELYAILPAKERQLLAILRKLEGMK